MDPARNPFAPGAGTPPPKLAGRQQVLAAAVVALRRVKGGKAAQGQLLLGLRGVGKTVLLNEMARQADALGFLTVVLEAPEDRRLAELLVPPLRHALFQLSRAEKAKQAAVAALGALRAFAAAFKVKVGDVQFGVEAARGTADSGDLDYDLSELVRCVAAAARASGRGVALFIDELQYLEEADLRALIVALHKSAQGPLPVLLFGAGLPQLAALAGEAKSYAERLFVYPPVGRLAPDDARAALREPIRREGAGITDAALTEILRQTDGYPYFVQTWGARAWDLAAASPITEADARRATAVARQALDDSFFRVRWDRLTPRERDYLRAMAELGPGPHQSGEIARALGLAVTSAAPLRNTLMQKGMIYSQQYGETAFTVPLFDQFLRRTMPGWKRARVMVPRRPPGKGGGGTRVPRRNTK